MRIASAVPAVIRKDFGMSFDSHGGENGSGGSGMTRKWQWQSLEGWMTSTHIRRRVLYGCVRIASAVPAVIRKDLAKSESEKSAKRGQKSCA